MAYPDTTYTGDTLLDIDGVPTAIKDLPGDLAAMAGYGHFAWDREHRRVWQLVNRVFPFTPETCLTDRYGGQGEWINSGRPDEALICPGCGMDFT